MFKRTFIQHNGLKSYGGIDLTKAVQIDFVQSLQPLLDENKEVMKNELGEEITQMKEGIVLTFPWTVQRTFPIPVEQPGKKGEGPKVSHYKHEPMWTNYTVIIDIPEEVDQIKQWMEKNWTI